MSSPSVYIRGMMEVDDQYEAMIQLKRACDAANAAYPQELRNYFGRADVDQAEYELKLGKFAVNILGIDTGGGGLHSWGTDSSLIENDVVQVMNEPVEDSYIYDIDLTKLPQALKTLRVEVSW